MTIQAGAARSAFVAAIAAAILAPALPHAQFLAPPPGPPVDQALRFEAASIKSYDAATGTVRIMMMPGRFEANGAPLRTVLRQALRLQDYQMIGVPDWVNNERHVIVAKAPDGAPPNAMPVMLLNLFKDRFNLATHTETRDLPIYNLVVSRSDGRLGAALKPTSAECTATIKARSGGPGPGGPGGPGAAAAAGPGGGRGTASVDAIVGRGGPPLPGTPGGPPLFDPNNPPCGSMRQGPGIVGAGGVPVAQLVQMLAQSTGRPVFDKTGLTGYYDFSLKFLPDPGMSTNPFGPAPPGGPAPVVDPDAANIFTAVQEQLGLKLESVRGPVEVTVIDRIERPTLD